MLILSMKLGILAVYDNPWGCLDLEPDSSGLWRNCSSWHITLFCFDFSAAETQWTHAHEQTLKPTHGKPQLNFLQSFEN